MESPALSCPTSALHSGYEDQAPRPTQTAKTAGRDTIPRLYGGGVAFPG